jgi:hypothetical protein
MTEIAFVHRVVRQNRARGNRTTLTRLAVWFLTFATILAGFTVLAPLPAHAQALIYAYDDSSGGITAISGESETDTGVFGASYGQLPGVSAYSASGHGVSAQGALSGVNGASFESSPGVWGSSSSGAGVYGESEFGDGVFGEASADNKSGVWGKNTNDAGYAGYFNGNVEVNGTFSKSGGSFKIDHPLEPENRYLQHSFVESPDMMNVYNGNVVLDEDGDAWVELPEWFEALNGEYRYQLTCVGGFAPVYIAEEIEDNRFKIAGGSPGLKVSWQVTGIRQDPWANAHRIQVEEWKPGIEIGTYLHPVEWGQPMLRHVEWVHHPDVMARQQQRHSPPGGIAAPKR